MRSASSENGVGVPVNGCQSGSSPAPFVSRVKLDPSASMTQMPPRAKAIRFPSGDHVGYALPPPDVSCVWAEPSAFMTKISPSAPCQPPYTIFVPSGDQSGDSSQTDCPSSVSRVKPEPSAFIV